MKANEPEVHHPVCRDGANPVEANLMLGVEHLHQSFAARLSARLGELLNATCDAKVASVERLRPEGCEIDDSGNEISAATGLVFSWMNRLAPDGPDSWYLVLEPSFSARAVDRMLGFSTNENPQAAWKRSLSQLELEVLQGVVDEVRECLVSSWADVIEEEDFLTAGAHTQQLSHQELDLDCLEIEMRLGIHWSAEATSYGMRLRIPWRDAMMFSAVIIRSHIEELATVLSMPPARNTKGLKRPPASLRMSKDGVGDASCATPELPKTRLTVNLARTTLSLKEVSELQVGDIVTTEQLVSDDAEVELLGFGRFAGKVGAVDGRKAIEITTVPPALTGNREA